MNCFERKWTQEDALHFIAEERDAQDEEWGESNHDVFTWLAILQKQLGKASECALDAYIADMAGRLVQVAAVCVAALECLWRKAAMEADLAEKKGVGE